MKSVVSSWMSQRILIILYQTPSLIMDLTSRTWLTLSPEAMRVILGCTRDTSSTGMWYYLDLPTMTERYNIVRLQDYLRVGSDETNSLHEKVGLIKTSRLSQAINTTSITPSCSGNRRPKTNRTSITPSCSGNRRPQSIENFIHSMYN